MIEIFFGGGEGGDFGGEGLGFARAFFAGAKPAAIIEGAFVPGINDHRVTIGMEILSHK